MSPLFERLFGMLQCCESRRRLRHRSWETMSAVCSTASVSASASASALASASACAWIFSACLLLIAGLEEARVRCVGY